jgi:hypothetical protein
MLPGLPGLVLTPAGAPFGFGASLPSMPAPPLWMPPQAAPSSGLLQAPPGAVWDHNDLAHNFNTMTLTPPPNIKWYMNSGAPRTGHQTPVFFLVFFLLIIPPY